MTRSNAREIAMHLSFALGADPQSAREQIERLLDKEHYETIAAEYELYGEYPNKKQLDYIVRLATGIGEHAAELDSYIEKYAHGWKLSRISRTAMAIMRLAMFEVLYMPDVPNAAAINDAVELAKKYEEKETVAFVNGVLGAFSRRELPEESAGEKTEA